MACGKIPLPAERKLFVFFLGHFRTLRHLRWEKLQMFKFGLRNSWSNELEDITIKFLYFQRVSQAPQKQQRWHSFTDLKSRKVFSSTSFRPQKSMDFCARQFFKKLAPIKMAPILIMSSHSKLPFLEKLPKNHFWKSRWNLTKAIMKFHPHRHPKFVENVTKQFFRKSARIQFFFFPCRRLYWETPQKLRTQNTRLEVGTIIDTCSQVFSCNPSYLHVTWQQSYIHHKQKVKHFWLLPWVPI